MNLVRKSLPVILFVFIALLLGLFAVSVSAEVKMDALSGGIPKLTPTTDDPELSGGHVYPSWGPVCQRYTYSVVYRDKEGRKPEYVKIYFNGKMIEMDPVFDKSTAGEEDYKRGVKYEYKYVPNKLGSNFYYFEASNGLGKARDSIIDSPDNGPVLFESAFDKNEIAVISKETGQKILSYSTGKEWIGGIALSDDGKYLAAKTSKHIYLFETNRPEKPLWEFVCEDCRIGDDVKGGVDISSDGSKIIAAIGENIILFDKLASAPLWKYQVGNAYNVAISSDGKYMGAATAGEEANVNSNLLILWKQESSTPFWQYHSSGNFHDVSLSSDGSFIAGSTGCPDRRFYLFSKDSNIPLIKTEMLTRDSPVHRAKISADGSLIAVGSESDGGAVFLFSKDSQNPLWKFPTPNGSSVRALNFTPDGQFIGAATFGGKVYIFEKENNQPVAQWQVANTALGGVDIADDGSFIAAAGTDNKVHIFTKDSANGVEVSFNEYVEEIDISGNGKYIAAGTGGSVYFFESFAKDEGKIFPCTTIIEPEPDQGIWDEGERGGSAETGLVKTGKWPGMLFGFGFLGSLFALLAYLVTVKLNLLRRPPERLWKFNKWIIIGLSAFMGIFLVLTAVSIYFNSQKPQTPSSETPSIGKQEQSREGVCGNDLCEPDLGETKASCPKDCSAGD